jgi:hypothetical protein
VLLSEKEQKSFFERRAFEKSDDKRRPQQVFHF